MGLGYIMAVNSNFENNKVFRALLSRHASTREILSANLAQLVAETPLDYSCKLDEQQQHGPNSYQWPRRLLVALKALLYSYWPIRTLLLLTYLSVAAAPQNETQFITQSQLQS